MNPHEFRAVHFDLDPWKTHLLSEEWRKLGFDGIPLDIIECPDRRLPRAAADMVVDVLQDQGTELSVLIPRREHTALWHRLLHDHSSKSIVAALADIPHCNVTIVPYHLGSRSVGGDDVGAEALVAAPPVSHAPRLLLATSDELPQDRARIAAVDLRHRAMVAGRVRSVRVQPFGGNPSLECTIVDETDALTLIFTGRRHIDGIRVGTRLTAEGTVALRDGKRIIMNPKYEFAGPIEPLEAPHH